MTEHLLANARRFTEDQPCDLEVRYEGGNRKQMADWLGAGLLLRPQGEGDLDRRMGKALENAFAVGAERVVLIGTDIPGITSETLKKAFEALRTCELVFGPAMDGGYYLIGMQRKTAGRAMPFVFEDIPWGTGAVLQKTLAAVKRIGLSFTLIDLLQDVDRPEDLSVWQEFGGAVEEISRNDRISIIIPALNEAGHIADTIACAAHGRDVEIIVVDGGSRDGTAEIACSTPARLITTDPSRAGQMNAGAAAATGGILLFLHGDTRLPDGFDGHVRQALARPGVVAGAFELGINADKTSLRIMERVANLRSRFLKKPYGDQALFTTAASFHRVGGFADIPIMEDFELVRRLGSAGRIEILPVPVVTSPRRWLRVGVWKTWLINQLVVVGYYLGISPDRLSRFYRRK
jgi:rSAM/selenodomain-associated transferase 2/rSAM/selenodomain-associated transferase 1